MTQADFKPKGVHWLALALLVVSVCISYVDRGNLGVAARSIESELHFTQDRLGILLGGFFWTYSLLQIAAGKIIDRWNVLWVYAAGYFLWSIATGLTGLANSFWMIFALRLMLGAGESVAYPACSKIIAATFPETLRGTANALIDAGSKVGPALGVLVGVEMVHRLSWRGMFVAIGAASMLWLLPWCISVPRLEISTHTSLTIPAPSYREMLSKRPVWGTIFGLFGANYTWYLLLTWLPYYFETARHYTSDRLAILGSLPFWAVAASSMCFGLLADKLIRAGRSAGPVRQTFAAVGLLGCCIFMLPAILIENEGLSNTLLVCAFISFGIFSSNHWALTQTLAGAAAAGKWTGIENCMGNLAGVAAPYVSGVILARTHSFIAPFAIACGVLLVGVAGYTIGIGKAAPVCWESDVTERSAMTY